MAKRWVSGDKPHTAVSCLPKNGSSSIKVTRANKHYLTPEEALNRSIRVGIIRHPLRRLISMYKFLKNQHETGASTLRHYPTGTYEAFVDWTMNHEDNHWKVQCELLETKEGVWIPTVMHRFEDLSSFWSDYFDVALPNKNASPSHYEVNEDYRIEEVLTKYRRDYDLWQSLGD
jgi:hypothetical protein